MTRWMLVGVAIAGLVMSWFTQHAGVLALGLLLAFIGVFGTLVSFASERVADRSRPDVAMLSREELAILGKPLGPDHKRGPGSARQSRTSSDGRS